MKTTQWELLSSIPLQLWKGCGGVGCSAGNLGLEEVSGAGDIRWELQELCMQSWSAASISLPKGDNQAGFVYFTLG